MANIAEALESTVNEYRLSREMAIMNPSLIREVANVGLEELARAGGSAESLIPLWFGEPDAPTPDFIKEAAKVALDRNETFYTHNRGVGELRNCIAAYQSRLYGRPVSAERVTITTSGMNAIMIAMQVLVEPGDNVVLPTPMWPNGRECVHLMGAETKPVVMRFINGRWRLDPEEVIDSLDERTKAIIVNSPNNPTGWTLTADEQRFLLDACRQRGIWMIADEVYDRFYYEADRAPSFLDIADPEDRLLVINSFSKSWSMTGWRLGWMVHPAGLGYVMENMNEFNLAGPTSFVQWAGIAAIEKGEPFIAEVRETYREGRDLVCDWLLQHPRIRLERPPGAFYVFFAVDGITESFPATVALARDARVGLAPGSAFGPGGEPFFRLCFANSQPILEEALQRLVPALDTLKQ